eukprot:TRINITY_DN91021_c0_g1_i1.p1 TRINITY_DN91021_c0_g1~~TRINITY_DN91021_c0_g1_i1.p1  ORF type:complete len:354 (+),score=78.97 TRINITY_DN91021_c0_g1_i1:50-1111(+)
MTSTEAQDDDLDTPDSYMKIKVFEDGPSTAEERKTLLAKSPEECHWLERDAELEKVHAVWQRQYTVSFDVALWISAVMVAFGASLCIYGWLLALDPALSLAGWRSKDEVHNSTEDMNGSYPPLRALAAESDDDCFPVESSVTLSTGAQLRMRDLEVGTRLAVMTSTGELASDSVIGFLHRTLPRKAVGFVGIQHARGELRATARHLIFVQVADGSLALREAAGLRAGDRLVLHGLGTGTSQVHAVTVDTSTTALYSPLTRSGMLVVDGALASVFAADAFTGRRMMLHQDAALLQLSQAATFPLRFLVGICARTECDLGLWTFRISARLGAFLYQLLDRRPVVHLAHRLSLLLK